MTALADPTMAISEDERGQIVEKLLALRGDPFASPLALGDLFVELEARMHWSELLEMAQAAGLARSTCNQRRWVSQRIAPEHPARSSAHVKYAHFRTLAQRPDIDQWAKRIVAEQLTVRGLLNALHAEGEQKAAAEGERCAHCSHPAPSIGDTVSFRIGRKGRLQRVCSVRCAAGFFAAARAGPS